ncbi:hypothetical protein [Mycobacterium sp. M26]|uniref:hypothetical protein n=1 Tax=Mycobacterium sp. M26 TaxID=1762962 RepID=UPI0012E3D0C2|nr:hypothetical protein [Mycobacterium sp. M26]
MELKTFNSDRDYADVGAGLLSTGATQSVGGGKLWHDVVTTVLGVVFGLLSGFYFERRNTKSAQAHNAELERELASLRSSIYNIGGEERLPDSKTSFDEALVGLVHRRARNIQGVDGQTSRLQLRSHFCAQGYSAKDVDDAIGELCDRGDLIANGKWLVIK